MLMDERFSKAHRPAVKRLRPDQKTSTEGRLTTIYQCGNELQFSALEKSPEVRADRIMARRLRDQSNGGLQSRLRALRGIRARHTFVLSRRALR